MTGSSSRHQLELGGATTPSRASSITAAHQQVFSGAGGGSMLSIVVTDTGHGIAKVTDTLTHISI